MLKQVFLLIILSFLLKSNSFSQNILSEGDFESDSWYEDYGKTCLNYSPFKYPNKHFNSWESAHSKLMYFRRFHLSLPGWHTVGNFDWENIDGEIVDCPCWNTHSPDILDMGMAYGVWGADGAFLHMGAYEMITQKIPYSNRLIEGKFYKVSMDVYIKEVVVDPGDKINIMLSENKLDYEDPGYRAASFQYWYPKKCLPADDIESPRREQFRTYKTLGQDIITVGEIYHDNLEKNEWVNVSIAFRMPEHNFDKYNWFAIDCSNEIGGDYLAKTYIDNIVLEEVERCNLEELCSPTDGYIVGAGPHLVEVGYSNHIIENLDNVSSAENIEIFDAAGNLIKTIQDKICPNGINYVHWDGRSQGGDYIAAGYYLWTMDLYNDCDYMDYTALLFLENMHLPILSDNFECNKSIMQPLICCEAEQNIFIENETIQGSSEVYFHAVNNIEITNTLIKSSATNVTFKAGNEIILNPGFETEEGAIVDMIIEPCEDKQAEKSDSLFNKTLCDEPIGFQTQKEQTNEDLRLSETSVFISPNPANDFFDLFIYFSEPNNNENPTMTITDISGKMHHQRIINSQQTSFYKDKINISNYPPGIYFINITSNYFSETKKLIVK